MIDETQIEQLVLDELVGIITPEDSATLKKLLEDEPEARIIRHTIYEQFSGPEEQAFLALSPESLPLEQVWAKIHKRKWVRVIIHTTLTIALLVLAAPSVYILFVKPEKLDKRTANVHGLSLKSVALQLPDGEIVNPGSPQQQVTIARKTYLSVTKEAQRPFIGHLPKGTIHVPGAEFNVNTYDKTCEKTPLIKGTIKPKTDPSTLMLKTGFSVRYQQGHNLQLIHFDPEEILAWRVGTYVFRATTIDELCQVMKRWYGMHIVYDDPVIGQRRFTGHIDKSRPMQNLIDNLTYTGHFNYHFDNDSVLHIR